MQTEDSHSQTLYPARVADFLSGRFGGRISDLSAIGHGEWSKAFGFRRDGVDLIARFNTSADDFLKDRRAMEFNSPALPIPRVLEIGEAFGGFYAISERATGEFIEKLDASSMRALLPSLFAALDAARDVDLSATHGYGAWDASGHAPHPSWQEALLDIATDRPASRTHGWRARLASSPTGSGPFDEAYARLTSIVHACPEERHLIHSDLLYFNVLVLGNRISAVIDWGNSMYGDFLFDIAWFSFWKDWYPAWRDIDFRAEASRHFASIGLLVPDFDTRMRCYETYIGLDGQAYQAFTRRWSDLARTAQRTLDVSR